jgi:formylglycine-generating enzyme required for sulfatase activity
VLPGAPLAANVDTDPTSTLPPRQLAAGETWRFSPPACDAVTLKTDAESVRLETRPRPVWASKWGADGYGVWADLIVKEAVIRWRWIAPGSFLMGSPDTEPGRDDDEGPRHWVTITRGFWMMATPCTQQQWTALIPKNPSRFVHPDRPVERVNVEDVNGFIRMLTEEVEIRFALQTRTAVSFRLPTEAEWEYACRAGSEDALYRVPGSLGQIEIRGENNAPSLDAIAWYGGNSGHGFELAEGEDSSRWPQKQRPHTVAGSRKVGDKLPNSWGLYDMLGNVCEWCLDGKRRYVAEAVTDPNCDSAAIGLRCVRGAGWNGSARYVRCGYRSEGSPGSRSRYLGFRLIRFQDGS